MPTQVVTAPPIGSTYGYVSTEGGVTGAGQVVGAGGTNGSEFITDAFSANGGDALDFYFNHVTADGTGQFIDCSFAELLTSLGTHVAWLFTARTNPSGDTSPGAGLPTNDSTLNPLGVGVVPGATNWSPLGGSSGSCWQGPGNGCGNTGWIESTYTIGGAGSYKLRLGVSNYGNIEYQSGLAYAGVTIAGHDVPLGAPEPASWAMMLGGFGLVGGALRRRRAAVAFG